MELGISRGGRLKKPAPPIYLKKKSMVQRALGAPTANLLRSGAKRKAWYRAPMARQKK